MLVFPRIVHADDAEKDHAFAEFVREGDRARLAGKNPDAVTAYEKALAIHQEPRTLGRLGLVYLAGGAPARAAHFLYRALIDISDVPMGERWLIQDAYNRARSAVTRIKVDISHLGADVFRDGKPELSKVDTNSFYFFTTPGPHEIRAKLVGFEDAIAIIDAQKGETITLSLVLKPIPPASPPSPAPRPAPNANEKRNGTTATNPKPLFLVKPSPWSVGAGVVALSGAISYVPAMGMVVSVDRRIDEVVSLRLDTRAAWSPYYVATLPLRGFTAAVLLGGCANRGKYFGCGIGHVGVIGHTIATEQPKFFWNWRPGLGAEFGMQVPVNKSVGVRFSGNLVLLLDPTVVVGGTYGQPRKLWEGPPVLGGLNLTLVWRPELRVLR